MLPGDENTPDQEMTPGSKMVPVRQERGLLANSDEMFEGSDWGTSQAADAPSLVPDGAAVIRVLRRRWLITLVLGGILATLGAVAGYRFLPIKHTAQVRFHISTQRPAIVFQSDGSDLNNYERTQVELIKSELVLKEAVQRPGIAELGVVREQGDPVAWLRQALKGEFPAPEILRLSLIDKNPKEIELVLDAIADAYLQEVVNKEKNERLTQLDRLKAIREEREEKLRKKRDAFQKRARETVSGDAQTLALSHRLAIEQMALAQRDLLQFQSELRKAEIELKIRQKQGDQSAPLPVVQDSDIDEQIEQDKTIADLRALNAEITKKIKSLQSHYSDGGKSIENLPPIKDFRFEIKENEETLAARKRELRPLIAKRLAKQAHGNTPNTTAQLAEQVTLLKELEKQLTADIKRLNEETKQIKESSIDLDEMRDDIAQIDILAKTVATRAEAIQVELDAPTRVTVLEHATVSQTTSESKRLVAAAGAGFAGLFVAVFGVLGWELRGRRILHPGEVSQGLHIRLLGTLPVLTQQGSGYVPTAASPGNKYPSNFFVESVDRTCLKLLHAARQESLRVLLITSAQSGEGKTSLAGHLALSLARSGKRTLLIDADLRRPALHRLFDLALAPGLSAVLRNELPVYEVIRPTLVDGLEIIPAGRGDHAAIRSLGSERLGTILRDLQTTYDFILVDSAPVMAVIDASLLAQHVDGVLFSVLCGASHLSSFYKSYQEIGSFGVRILGAVVSGVRDTDSGGYGYGYGSIDRT